MGGGAGNGARVGVSNGSKKKGWGGIPAHCPAHCCCLTHCCCPVFIVIITMAVVTGVVFVVVVVVVEEKVPGLGSFG